jgi:hypothetical protein
VDGDEGWKGLLFFNADRRVSARFDPATDTLSLSLGSHTISFPAGTLEGNTNSIHYRTPSGQVPSEAIKLSLSKQTLRWKFSHDTLEATVPGLQDVVLILGSKSYRTTVLFDENGSAKALASVRPCFVIAKGQLRVRSADPDSATLAMLLSDPGFIYQTGDPLRLRLLQGATVLLDRDFTALGAGQQSTNKDGKVVFTVKTTTDTETANRISKFSYVSATGKLSVVLAGLTLDALTNGEDHLTAELTIGARVYTTAVTFFGANPGSYSTTIP